MKPAEQVVEDEVEDEATYEVAEEPVDTVVLEVDGVGTDVLFFSYLRDKIFYTICERGGGALGICFVNCDIVAVMGYSDKAFLAFIVEFYWAPVAPHCYTWIADDREKDVFDYEY